MVYLSLLKYTQKLVLQAHLYKQNEQTERVASNIFKVFNHVYVISQGILEKCWSPTEQC